MGGIVLCQDAASKSRIKVVNEACWRFQRAMFLFRFVHICSVLFPWLPFQCKKPLRCFWRRPKEACIPLINARSSRTTSLRSKILSVSPQCQVEDGTGRYCRRWWEIVSPCQHGHGWPTGYRVRKREFSTPFSWDERVGRLASWFFLVSYFFHASQFIQVPLKIWVYFVQKQVLFASTWKPIADPLLCKHVATALTVESDFCHDHWPRSFPGLLTVYNLYRVDRNSGRSQQAGGHGRCDPIACHITLAPNITDEEWGFSEIQTAFCFLTLCCFERDHDWACLWTCFGWLDQGHCLHWFANSVPCRNLRNLLLISSGHFSQEFQHLGVQRAGQGKATTITTGKRKGWNGSHPGEAKYHLSVMWGDMGHTRCTMTTHTHTHLRDHSLPFNQNWDVIGVYQNQPSFEIWVKWMWQDPG